MSSLTLAPEAAAHVTSLAATEGDARWFFGDLVVFKLTGAMTGGRFAMVEFTAAKGSAPPPHVHEREDEVFLLQEGEMTFRVGDTSIEAKAGHVVLAPKHLVHSYVVTSPSARWLVLTFPAGFEDFVREASAPARELRLPRAGEPQGDAATFVGIGARHGIEFLMG